LPPSCLTPGRPTNAGSSAIGLAARWSRKIEKKKMPGGRTVERIKEETEGGILHWRGLEPNSGGRKKKEQYRRKAKFYEEELGWFRQQIRNAYGGRVPRVLDPFPAAGPFLLKRCVWDAKLRR